MFSGFKKAIQFVKDVAADPRIPEKDKKIILAMALLIVSPIDLIPDWIPILGQLDDLIYLAIICDYFFEVLDPEILLSHYPWGMKSFLKIKRLSRVLAFMVPRFIRKRIWSYVGSPYRKR